MNTASNLKIATWTLGLLVIIIGITAWSPSFSQEMSLVDIFPVFGILAFSLMWTHYVSGALRQYLKQPSGTLKTYFKVTSGAVLALILLHPGLFYLQLYLNGLGLPPNSYYQAYPALSARIALTIATVSLLIFLSFELHRKFGKRSWWKYVEYANVAAMFGIFYHALTLGSNLMTGWFRVVWYIYGITLLAAIIYSQYHKYRKTNKVPQQR